MMMMITIGAAMVTRRGNTDIKMAIAMASSKAGMKGERTIPRTSAFPTRAKPAAVTGTGWGRFGFIKMAIGTDIALDSVRATIMRAVPGATVTAVPMMSRPSTAAAVMADPGSIIGPTRLVFKMARQLHAKMRHEANHTTPDHADATMMKIMATAAFTATRALIRLNTQTATVPATSLHATATKLFQVASRDELPASRRPVPGEGLTVARHVFLQPSEQCRISKNVGMTDEEL